MLKKQIKKWICVWAVCVAAVVAVPQETKADTLNLYFHGDETWIYENAKEFYAGDLIEIDDLSEESGYLSQKSGVTYESSNAAVAKIDKKTGKLTIKKRGTTTIKAKYKGETKKFKLKVVSKDKIKKTASSVDSLVKYRIENLSRIEKNAKRFLKNVGANTTSVKPSERYKLLNEYKRYKRDWTNEGYIWDYLVSEKNSYKLDTISYIYCTEALCANRIANEIHDYGEERNPFGAEDDSKHLLKIKSISGKSGDNKITVKLKKKVTADQIFGAYYHYSWDSDVKESKTYTFPIYIKNQSSRFSYYAEGKMKEGSSTIIITIKNHKLKNNTQYMLLDRNGYWLKYNVNSFTTK